MPVAVARIRIQLDDFDPAIWRRVEVPLTTSLEGLHEVIQAVMLFENSSKTITSSSSTSAASATASRIRNGMMSA